MAPRPGAFALLARLGSFVVLAVLLVLLLVFRPPLFAILAWMAVATAVQWYCAKALAP